MYGLCLKMSENCLLIVEKICRLCKICTCCHDSPMCKDDAKRPVHNCSASILVLDCAQMHCLAQMQTKS